MQYKDIAETCKNNTLKKFNNGEIVKPAFKYIVKPAFGNSNMEAKVAKPGEVLTASQCLVVNFKLGKINTEFKLKNSKKNLNHCNIRI